MTNEPTKASTTASTLITLACLALGGLAGVFQLFAGFEHGGLHTGTFFFCWYPLAIVVTVITAAFNSGSPVGRWSLRVALFCLAAEAAILFSFMGLFAGVH